jgi:peptidoglycan/LPS O-acetylase OafA/YrhL
VGRMTGAEEAPLSTQDARHFSPDIQGLRAVAVIAVVAFHVGLPVSPRWIHRD